MDLKNIIRDHGTGILISGAIATCGAIVVTKVRDWVLETGLVLFFADATPERLEEFQQKAKKRLPKQAPWRKHK